jgi:uncharacterized protein DUF3883
VPETAARREWKWFCEIEDYAPFRKPVPAKVDGVPIEAIAPNQWAVMRDLPVATFERILRLGGGVATRPTMPTLEDTNPAMVPSSTSLLIAHPQGEKGGGGGHRSGGRRSRFSKAVGDRAEEAVFKYLKASLPPGVRKTVRWVASEGETPGWDIEYLDGNELVAVEVKGTQGPAFLSVELTGGEWSAARDRRKRYWLFLVADCLSPAPRIEPIQDPWGCVETGQWRVTPITWRVELVAEAVSTLPSK